MLLVRLAATFCGPGLKPGPILLAQLRCMNKSELLSVRNEGLYILCLHKKMALVKNKCLLNANFPNWYPNLVFIHPRVCKTIEYMKDSFSGLGQ